jgi:hypothetical protein
LKRNPLKRTTDLIKKRKELEKKKAEWETEIKSHIQQIELQLGRMEQKNFTLKKDNQGYYYENDTTGEIEHHLGKIKEIFEDSKNEESSLQMKEKDAEEEKNANTIKWADYKKAIGG